MPHIAFSRSIAAGATDTPLQATAWQYEYPGYAAVRVLSRTTAAGVTQRIASGARIVQDTGPVQAGGTAGVTPSELNTTPIEFMALPGERISVSFTNTTGGALTVDTLVQVEPLA